VSGVGNPDKLSDFLKKHQIKIKDHLIFPDHHLFGIDDLKKIAKYAEKNKIDSVLMTLKDFVKIEPFYRKFNVNLDFKFKIYYIDIEFKVLDDKFWQELSQKVIQKAAQLKQVGELT
jgi:tetraacyldisaccharide-1-P 4'-kinase